MSDVELSPVVARIASRFVNGDVVRMSTDDLERSMAELSALHDTARDHAVSELLAIASKLQRAAGFTDTTSIAIGQLLLMAGALLADIEAAVRAFEAAGVDARHAIGGEASLKPVEGSAGSGASLFALRTGSAARERK